LTITLLVVITGVKLERRKEAQDVLLQVVFVLVLVIVILLVIVIESLC